MLIDRWRGVKAAGWFALLAGVATVILFTLSTKGKDSPPTLLYPYLASGAVYMSTCIWILSGALVGAQAYIDPSARERALRSFWWVFILSTALLLFAGLAGGTGRNAVSALNWYLFGVEADPVRGPKWATLGMPFAALAAVCNGLAFGTLMFLGALCNGLTAAADVPHRDAGDVLELSRKLFQLLILASALMVTSTLTIYLLFGVTDQIQPLRPAKPGALAGQAAPASKTGQATTAASAAAPTAPVTVSIAASAATPAVVACASASASTANLSCASRCDAAKAKPASSAAYMAMVCGLSFTSVLFVLFMSCSTALDDRVSELMMADKSAAHTWASVAAVTAATAVAIPAATPPPAGMAPGSSSFSVKDWRDRHGVVEAAATSQVLKALALLAPALTGFLTLLAS